MKTIATLVLAFAGLQAHAEISDCRALARILQSTAEMRDKGTQNYDVLSVLLQAQIPMPVAGRVVEFVFDNPNALPQEFYIMQIKICEREEWRDKTRKTK